MEQRIDKLSGRTFRVDEVTRKVGENGQLTEHRRQIVEFVIADGIFPIEDGVSLGVEVCTESKKHQKLILTGALPTVKRRGILGKSSESGMRRVVSVPVFDAALSTSPITVVHEVGMHRQYHFQIQKTERR